VINNIKYLLLFLMMQTFRKPIYSFAVGVAAGTSGGLVGWGGGQIIIPSMTFPVLNLSQLSATGISLTSLSFSSISSGYKFWRDERVHIPLALAIGLPAVVSARIGSRFASKLSGDALALIFNAMSIVLIPTHFYVQRRAFLRETCEGESLNTDTIGKDAFSLNDTRLLQHVSFGIFSGVLSSLMGVGGLPLAMSYITEATELPHHYVQGTAICALVPSIFMSAASRIHSIPVHTASFVAFGALVGGYGGAKLALQLTEEQLRTLFMASLVLFGGRSAVGAAQNIKRIVKAIRL
jgi:uncharacterized membrane protein YfcA